ncbi:MAG: hypothetical protein P1U63_03310 [Coxiellaceae bacterium]|nr:hypothetical protein [Coxiellaceae bacterium]
MKTLKNSSLTLAWLLTTLVAVILPLLAMAFTHFHLPFWDEWDDNIPVYLHYLHHNLTLHDMLRHHNEHRMLFNRVIFLASYILTPQSTHTVLYACYAIVITYFFYTIYCIKKTCAVLQPQASTFSPWFYLLLAMLIFPTASITFWRWPINIEFPATVLFATVAIFSLQKPCTWKQIAICSAFCLLAGFSSANGMAVFPIAWLLLLAYRSQPKKLITFAVISIVSVVLYRYNTHTATGFIIDRPLMSMKYFISFLGNPVGYRTSSIVPRIFGAVALVSVVLLSHAAYKRFNAQQQALLPWVGLSLFALCNALMGSVVRVNLGIAQSTSPRYVCITTMLYIAIVVLTKVQWPYFSKRVQWLLRFILTTFAFYFIVQAYHLVSSYLYSYYSPQEIALPYDVFLPADNSLYPVSTLRYEQRLSAYKNSPIYPLKTPEPNYLGRHISPDWIKQHGTLVRPENLNLIIGKPTTNKAHIDFTYTGSSITGQIRLRAPATTRSNSLLLLNQQRRVVGIAFAAIPHWPAKPRQFVEIYGFMLGQQPVQLLWLNQHYQIKQPLTPTYR